MWVRTIGKCKSQSMKDFKEETTREKVSRNKKKRQCVLQTYLIPGYQWKKRGNRKGHRRRGEESAGEGKEVGRGEGRKKTGSKTPQVHKQSMRNFICRSMNSDQRKEKANIERKK